jgi:hypothetical protein
MTHVFDKFKKIGERIYVLENFISESERNVICQELSKTNWIQLEYENVTGVLKESDILIKKLQNLLNESFNGKLNLSTSFKRLLKGQTMGIHFDANYDPSLDYAIIVYLNPFEGGQLHYREQGITFQPKVGDLVIHGADKFCTHQVFEVKSDIRYIYVSNISK